MNKTLLILVSLVALVSGAKECGTINLPNSFKIVEKVFTLTNGLKIKTYQNQDLGRLNVKFFSLKDTYVLRDSQDMEVAKAKQRILAWGLYLDIEDCNGLHIGSIKLQNIIANALSADSYAVYTIYDANKNAVAQSERISIASTKFSFYSLNGQKKELATLSRSLLGGLFNDHWKVEIQDSSMMDAKTILFMAAFKTYYDNLEDQIRLTPAPTASK